MTVYRRNPLLMTVMGANPGPRTRKGVERALDEAISSSWHRLMSGVQVPIMDIPRIFRDIKLEMAAGVSLDQAVLAVGSRYRVNPGRYHRNPLGEAIVGGLAGALVNRAFQSNPHLEGYPCGTCGGELVYLGTLGNREHYRCRNCGMDVSTTAPSVHRHQRRRRRQPPGGRVRSNPAIRSEWDRLTDRRRLAVLEFAGIPYEQARRLARRPWGTLPPSIQDEVAKGWQENPSSRKAQKFMSREVSHLMRDKGYPQKRAVAAAYAIARRKGFKLNPGPRGKRRVTITVEQFADWVKRQRNPEMWHAFLAKFKGYENWTDGARARKVQLE